MAKFPPRPWTRERSDRDGEDYPVVRDRRGAPVVFIEKTLDPVVQNRIAGIVVAGPDLLEAVREIVFAQETGDKWNDKRWQIWRAKHGPALAIAMGMI